MIKVIDKIIRSSTPPSNPYTLWLKDNGSLLFRRGEAWKNIGGYNGEEGGGGSLEASPKKYAGLTGKKISFLGDSITTFKGYLPAGYNAFYPHSSSDITSVDKTWWYQLISTSGMELLANASWSGSYLTGESNGTSAQPGCSSMRVNALSSNGVSPDIIIVMIGINDFYGGKTIGTWSGGTLPSDGTISTMSEAYALLTSKILTTYPEAELYLCTLVECGGAGNDSKTLLEFNDCIRMVAHSFGCHIIDMHACGINFYNKEKYLPDNLHPNAEGAKLLAKRALADLTATSKWMHQLPSDSENTTVALTGLSSGTGITSYTLNEGETQQLSVAYIPTDTTQKGVTWSSDNTGIAKVAAGVVTAVSEGSATITATSVINTNIKASWTFTVKAAEEGEEDDSGNNGDTVNGATGPDGRSTAFASASSIPDGSTADTNLWPLMTVYDGYYETQGNLYTGYVGICHIAFPVLEGDKIYASSFAEKAIKVAFFQDATFVQSVISSDQSLGFTTNGYITVPSGCNAVVIPMWEDNDSAVVNLLSLENESSGDDSTSGITGPGGRATANRFASSIPMDATSETDLWSISTKQEGYVEISGVWTQSGNIKSIVIPVLPGDHIDSYSFKEKDVHGGSMNGITVAFFKDDTFVSAIQYGDVYNLHFKVNGYVTCPEGDYNCMVIPQWNSDDENNYVKMLTL